MDTCGLSLLLRPKSPQKSAFFFARNSEVSARAWSENLTDAERPLLDSDVDSLNGEPHLQVHSSSSCAEVPGNDGDFRPDSTAEAQEGCQVPTAKLVDFEDVVCKPAQELALSEQTQVRQGWRSRAYWVVAMLVCAVLFWGLGVPLVYLTIARPELAAPGLRLAFLIGTSVMGGLFLVMALLAALSGTRRVVTQEGAPPVPAVAELNV